MLDRASAGWCDRVRSKGVQWALTTGAHTCMVSPNKRASHPMEPSETKKEHAHWRVRRKEGWMERCEGCLWGGVTGCVGNSARTDVRTLHVGVTSLALKRCHRWAIPRLVRSAGRVRSKERCEGWLWGGVTGCVGNSAQLIAAIWSEKSKLCKSHPPAAQQHRECNQTNHARLLHMHRSNPQATAKNSTRGALLCGGLKLGGCYPRAAHCSDLA